MEATAALPRGPLRLLATHLGLRPAERRRQFARLREIILADAGTPLVLLGDFNEWRDRGVRRHLSDLFAFAARTRHRSFPSRLPSFALDRILCRGGAAIVASRAVREAGAASDHLPVAADIVLPDAG
jgi:endonuclease/exonuclease/phosphatase family metal-dependent hydrolase